MPRYLTVLSILVCPSRSWTALILAIANQIFLFHRLTPLSRAYCATRFVTIIRVGRKDRTVPLGLAKKRSRAVRTTHSGWRIGA